MSLARDLVLLVRPRIGLLAAAGTLAGSVACAPAALPGLAAAGTGAWLLSCGCSALNQVQERAEDGRMERTRGRPLPAGRLAPGTALALAAACLGLAALALAATPGGAAAVALVPAIVLLYNGLYTPLKKRTSLAMLVGGLAGACPPLLGFAAAGGSILDPRALLLAGIFYAWQVPHFWLFARIHRADYAAAGFHAPQGRMGQGREAGTLLVWLLGYGALLLLVPAFGLVSAAPLKWLVTALALALLALARPISRPVARSAGGRERLGFALVNASLALLLVFLAADALRLAV